VCPDEAVAATAERQPVPVSAETISELLAFLARRLELMLLEEGHAIEQSVLFYRTPCIRAVQMCC
jgi:hypothetical protein